MKYFKHTEKYRMVITLKSPRLYSLQKLHVLLCFSTCSVLHCLYSGTQTAQAATIWDIIGPGWSLMDSSTTTFAHNSLDQTNHVFPLPPQGPETAVLPCVPMLESLGTVNDLNSSHTLDRQAGSKVGPSLDQ